VVDNSSCRDRPRDATIRGMIRTLLLCAAAITFTASFTAAASIPPDANGAEKALAASPRHGEYVEIALPGSDTKLKSWVVYPERKEKAGVVIVIHEIFGLTDWVRGVADQLAADGFIAIAPDFLSGMGPGGGGTEALGESVRGEIRKLSPDEVNKRIDAARAYGLKLPAANGKTATIGYCWGGAASFRYATHQPELNAAVVYYGSAPRKGEGGKEADVEALKKIKAPVLGLYGKDDARVNSTIDETKKILDEAGKSYTTHLYEGAGHGFLRQQGDRDGANKKASEQAWEETRSFLKKHLE
jgi:carboxymethylenebutenolidase